MAWDQRLSVLSDVSNYIWYNTVALYTGNSCRCGICKSFGEKAPKMGVHFGQNKREKAGKRLKNGKKQSTITKID